MVRVVADLHGPGPAHDAASATAAEGHGDVGPADVDVDGAVAGGEPDQLAPHRLGDRGLASLVVGQQQPRREVQCIVLEAVALGLPAVRVGIVGRREEPRHEQRGELVRLEGAVFRDQRHGLVDPGPGLAGEDQIGRHVDGARGTRRRADGEPDADRGGPGGQRRGRGTRGFRQRVGVERHPIVPGGDPDGYLRHTVERVVPVVTLQPPVGLEQARRDAVPFGGAPERLRLGRLRVAVHDKGVPR